LCDAIANNRATKQYLLENPIGYINRQTYPDFLNTATIKLFEEQADRPLIVACRQGDIEAIEILLSKGADPNEMSGFSAIEAVYASPKKDNRLEIAQLLVKHQADVTLHIGKVNAVFLELNYSKDEAISWDNIRFLVDNGCPTTDYYENTILHYASRNGSVYIADKILSEKLVDIDAQNQDGSTAIIFATQEGDRQMVQYLLSKGCDKQIADNNNKTAYDYAVEDGNAEIAELLKP
jgi:serine/threonine-protein phosphatase 6 regulatory ankyrin repeat subunit B